MSTDINDNGIVFPPMTATSVPEMGPGRIFGPARALQASEHVMLRSAIHHSVAATPHHYRPIRASTHKGLGRSVDRVG